MSVVPGRLTIATGCPLSALIVVTMTLALGASGCGRSSPGHKEERTRNVTAPELIRLFADKTGYRLVDRKSPSISGVPRVERLDIPRPTRSAAAQHYGYFSLFVYPTAGAAVASLRGSAPDAHGIYWSEEVIERGPRAGQRNTTAEKRYGNVVLAWSRADGVRRLDERWGRLDEIVTAIAQA
jgi:hypothetical protein